MTFPGTLWEVTTQKKVLHLDPNGNDWDLKEELDLGSTFLFLGIYTRPGDNQTFWHVLTSTRVGYLLENRWLQQYVRQLS